MSQGRLCALCLLALARLSGDVTASPSQRGPSLAEATGKWAQTARRGGLGKLGGPEWDALVARHRGREEEGTFAAAIEQLQTQCRERPDELLARLIVLVKIADAAKTDAIGRALIAYVEAIGIVAGKPEAYAKIRALNREFAKYMVFRILNFEVHDNYIIGVEGFLQYFIGFRGKSALPYQDVVRSTKDEVPHAAQFFLSGHRDWPCIRTVPPLVWRALGHFLRHDAVAFCFEGDDPDIPKALLVRALAATKAKDYKDAEACLQRVRDVRFSSDWEGVRRAIRPHLAVARGDVDAAMRSVREALSQPVTSCAFGEALGFLAEHPSIPKASATLAEAYYRALLTGPGLTFRVKDLAGQVARRGELQALRPWVLRLLLADLAAQGGGDVDEEIRAGVRTMVTLASRSGLSAPQMREFLRYVAMGPAGPDGQLRTADDLPDPWQGPLDNWRPPAALVRMAREFSHESTPNDGRQAMRRAALSLHTGDCDGASRLVAAVSSEEPVGGTPGREELVRARRLIEAFAQGHVATPGTRHPAVPNETRAATSLPAEPDPSGPMDGSRLVRIHLLRRLLRSGGSAGEPQSLQLVRRLLLDCASGGGAVEDDLTIAWTAVASLFPNATPQQSADRISGLLDAQFGPARRSRITLALASRLLRDRCYGAADAHARCVESESPDVERRAEARVIRIMIAAAQGKPDEGLALARAAEEWGLGPLGKARIAVAAGWSCMQSGDMMGARKYFSQAAKIRPGNAYTKRAAQMLDRIKDVPDDRGR